MSRTLTVPVTIANGATVSSVAQAGNMDLVGIQLPAAFTGVAMTFQAATDSPTGTFQPVYDDAGAQISVTVAQGHYVAIGNTLLKALRGMRWIKAVSGSAEGAARQVVLVFADRS